MVRLSENISEYPWNSHAELRVDDTEILTIRATDPSKVWKLPLLPCLPGFAYVGFKVSTYQTQSKPLTARIAQANDKPIFGAENDAISTQTLYSEGYIPFTFPIVSRLCHLNKDEIHLVLSFKDKEAGVVQILAQKFEDLPQDDLRAKYYYVLNDRDGYLLKTNEVVSFLQCNIISLINFDPGSIRIKRFDLALS